MKMKIISFLIVFGITVICYAQQNKEATNLKLVPKSMAEKAIVDNYNESVLPINFTFNKELAAVPFSSSGNAYTLLSGKKMTMDAVNKTVLYTHRAGGPFGNTSHNIKLSMSANYGNTWDSTLIVAPNSAHLLRYPGGTFFRPDGGSDLYLVSSGPITNGTNWIANYFASCKTDGTDFHFQHVDVPSGTGIFHVNTGLSVLPNGSFLVVGEKNGLPPDYPHIDYSIFKFNWNSTAKNFDIDNIIELTPTFVDGMPPVQPFGMAFSDDGSVGYFWSNGQISPNSPNLSTQPLVWKTIDAGENWEMMPVFDFSTIQELKDYVWAIMSNQSRIRPLFFYGYTTSEKDIPGIVDKNGNLNLLVTMIGGYSEHPDSLGYTYLHEPTKIFNIFTTPTGWDAKYIDTLQTNVQYVSAGGSGQFGDFSLDHRLHIGKSNDGNKIFAMWTDTDPLDGQITENIIPDLKAWGRDITTGLVTTTKNFTQGTLLDGAVLYMNASEIVMFNNDKYNIPVVYVQPTSTGDPVGSAIIHYYVKDIYFVESDFVTNPYINKIVNPVSFVSQNYPNPFTEKTTIDVTIQSPTTLSIEVMNILGQLVYKNDAGNVQSGKHRFVIDGSMLKPGIYLYTIHAGGNSVTKKMIVK